ncbi:CRISPR-associated helicase Cas3' [Calidithermus roseus]|uniref:Putative CRISPR-associated nuclease/helicase Cas3 n=1 Tax=Calidithermus roseus TaxID=1644118 RepID=A0A399EZG3_9DEIN|nr:CRISPR-associated helicase Cas3' [Calidithermus roseus]RIH88975.1 putative CRISPR-associated nuclease/helicase Cas3 [Calidithermus roseus]
MNEGIGRVFFREGEVGFQLLSNHQALVVHLLEKWRESEGEGPLELSTRTRERVLEAARYHDDGKRFTLRIKRDEESGDLTYSFRGHRFRVAPEVTDPYAQALIRGHHDYSTREVVSLASDFAEEGLHRRFPEDLFLLMMADQLEAELAVRLFEGKSGEVRPFVEFDLLPGGEGEESFLLDPWPFQEDRVELVFQVYFHPYREEEPKVVECWGHELVGALGRGVKPWGFRREERRVRLQPWQDGRLMARSADQFYAQFKRQGTPMNPTPLQEKVFRTAGDDLAHLLLASTGAGKTEAAAFPALARGERLVFVLPTRSLIDDLENRFSTYLQTLASREGRPKGLVVDTGHRQVRRLLYPDGRGVQERERHLYHADVILTTLDKLLYRYFGYAEGAKSYTFPRRIHDRKTLFVFDEVHLYEATAWVNFRRLIASLSEAGVRFLVMSATMPEAYQKELAPYLLGHLEAQQAEPPSRLLYYLPQGELGELAQKSFREERRVLLVVEEVRQAAELYRALRGEGVFLYHGRLADRVRKGGFREVKDRDEARKPYLLITTPAIEVGVDLDAEILLTSLCPPENLLQRLGRVNRRGKGQGAAYVVGEVYPEYLGRLPEGYLELLRELSGKDLAGGGELRLKESIRYPRYLDSRAETLFEMLQEYVYRLDLTQEPLYRKGFVATRGWTPSVRLQAQAGEDEVEVPVDRLIGRKEELTPVRVVERVWANREEGGRRWMKVYPPRSGELYGRELVVSYPYDYDPALGFVELPKVFQRIRHPDPGRVQLLYTPERAPAESQEGVLDSDQFSGGKGRVIWYLGESAWAGLPEELPQVEEPAEAEEEEA